jgi:hypothetical protein
VDARHLIILAMVLLPVALFIWARRPRRTITPEVARAAYEAMRANAPMTRDLAKAVGAHFARNAYQTEGVIEAVYGPDDYGVRLVDGTLVRGGRSRRLRWSGVILARGARVVVLALRGSDDNASILWRL